MKLSQAKQDLDKAILDLIRKTIREGKHPIHADDLIRAVKDSYPSLGVRRIKTLLKEVDRDNDIICRYGMYSAEDDTRTQRLTDYYKKRIKALEKETVLQDKVLAVCQEAIVSLPSIVDTSPIIVAPGKTEEVTVALLGDLHVGEEVSSEEVGGLNLYNFDVFARRYQYYVDTVINLTKNKLSGYTFRKLYMPMLGDMVSGEIHDELKETSRLDVMSQAFNGAYVVAQGIRELAKNFDEIIIDGIVGNHGRVSQKKKYKRKYVSWDYVFYSVVALLLRDVKNVKTYFPKSFFTTKDINGHDFLLFHGGEIRSWQGTPWYGIEKAIAKFNELLKKRIEYVLMGHFHISATMDKLRGERIINGSFSGLDEFSVGRLFTGTGPRQLIFGVHKKFGATWRYPIKLEYAPMNNALRYKYEIPFDQPLIAGEMML